MIHISTLDDDFYHPSSDGNSLIGRRSQNTYSLGQHIMVQVERVDRFKRQIDFRVTAKTDRIDKRTKEKPGGRGSGRPASRGHSSRGGRGGKRPERKAKGQSTSGSAPKKFTKPRRGGKKRR